MPIYEFQCGQCHEVIERILPRSEDALTSLVCRGCGGRADKIPSVTVVGHVGVKKVAARVDERARYNAARGKRSSNV